jgi:hypothetical protein
VAEGGERRSNSVVVAAMAHDERGCPRVSGEGAHFIGGLVGRGPMLRRKGTSDRESVTPVFVLSYN